MVSFVSVSSFSYICVHDCSIKIFLFSKLDSSGCMLLIGAHQIFFLFVRVLEHIGVSGTSINANEWYELIRVSQ